MTPSCLVQPGLGATSCPVPHQEGEVLPAPICLGLVLGVLSP